MRGTNTSQGWEDLVGGGDQDFNDVVIGLSGVTGNAWRRFDSEDLSTRNERGFVRGNNGQSRLICVIKKGTRRVPFLMTGGEGGMDSDRLRAILPPTGRNSCVQNARAFCRTGIR